MRSFFRLSGAARAGGGRRPVAMDQVTAAGRFPSPLTFREVTALRWEARCIGKNDLEGKRDGGAP
jgi:hypothetical protein